MRNIIFLFLASRETYILRRIYPDQQWRDFDQPMIAWLPEALHEALLHAHIEIEKISPLPYMPQYLLLRQIKATKVASLFFLGGAELKGAALVVAVSDAESALHFILKGA